MRSGFLGSKKSKTGLILRRSTHRILKEIAWQGVGKCDYDSRQRYVLI